MKKSVIAGRELYNSKALWVQGMPLTNSNGDIDSASTGFQYAIDTLTYIRSKVIKQKFYEIAIADFMPVDVGEAAWMDFIKQNLSFQTGSGFYDGDVDIADSGRIATVDTLLSPITMPVKTWAKQSNWTVMEIAKAAAASNWDVVSDKLASLKKNWDLGYPGDRVPRPSDADHDHRAYQQSQRQRQHRAHFVQHF